MAKNSYDDAIRVLIGILVVASLIAIFLVKWAIIGVVLLISTSLAPRKKP